ncbi:LysR family transcriptional regulator [Inquilinus sp. NPDC058860]|uniref:LysR family transcriptional regulator n=1 Tax=Inquilinus sp. NPDC058860 TaxID=3346652 RepID=UPI0036919D34
MDIRFAQTFLEIVNSGSFVSAAERLNVAQTTVGARIKILEGQLGQKLFSRSKTGATLTPAGEQFLRHAPNLVEVWRRACEDVARPASSRASLAVGGEFSLWNPLLLNWLLKMRQSAPHIAIRTEISIASELSKQVSDGVLHIAVMYQLPQSPGLRVEELLTEKLVCVTTQPNSELDQTDYVFVDWGPRFAASHRTNFPDLVNPGLLVDLGPLGLSFILKNGGAGYFRSRTAQPFLRTGKLRRVSQAPEFTYPVHVVYHEGADQALLGPALAALRDVAATELDEWPIETEAEPSGRMRAKPNRRAKRR